MRPSSTAALSATVTILAALSLAACSTDPAPAAATDSTNSPTPARAAATTNSTSPRARTGRHSTSPGPSRETPAGYHGPKILDPKTGLIDICRVRQDPFTGKAAEKFGAKDVMAAYCEIGNFALNEGFTDLMETKERKPVAFSFVDPWLSPEGRAMYDKTVTEALNGDTDSAKAIAYWIGWNLEGDDYDFTDKYPRALRQTIHPALAWVDGDRLALRVVTTADLVMTRTMDGAVGAIPVRRTTDYALVRGHDDKPWLVDGWTPTVKYGQFSRGLG